LLEEIPHDQLIIDNSQALLTLATNVLATIYSPRKFVGVPDGGLLVTADLEIRVPECEDTGSVDRMRHLLLRTAYSARDGYSDYVESERSLSDTRPLRMSRLTSACWRASIWRRQNGGGRTSRRWLLSIEQI
jgi:hypothetical protein